MSNISVNITELKQLLEATPASHNIMLVGNHGIGKSEILTEFFKEKGMPVVALFLGQMADPGDLIGLPTKDEKTGKTEFMPPYWFPVDGKPIGNQYGGMNSVFPVFILVHTGSRSTESRSSCSSTSSTEPVLRFSRR